MNFQPFFSDYPEHKTPCLVNIGDYKLYLRVLIDQGEIREVTIPIRQDSLVIFAHLTSQKA